MLQEVDNKVADQTSRHAKAGDYRTVAPDPAPRPGGLEDAGPGGWVNFTVGAAVLGQSGVVADLPESGFRRGLRVAGLPAGHAIRAAAGLGKRIGGRPAEIVAAEVQARSAAQLFQVLGELKVGALKLGQAMSAMEALLPVELAGPYLDVGRRRRAGRRVPRGV